jgi:hypothetical protein
LTGNPGATGPSASVYGDGSDGALDISGTVDWTTTDPGSTLQYSSITIESGATLTVPSGLILRSTGTVTINGTIIVASNPWAGKGIGSTPAQIDAAPSLCGCSLGQVSGGAAVNPLVGRLLLNPGTIGGGAGPAVDYNLGASPFVTPAGGGGTIVILASGNISIGSAGSIHADGDAGIAPFFSGGGGGGGGIIVLATKGTISSTGAGLISATGGPGVAALPTAYSAGGGGGGGIVNLLASSTPSIAGTINVKGGTVDSTIETAGFSSGGGGSGGAGGSSNNAGAASPGNTGQIYTRVISDPSTLFAPAVTQ